LRNTPDSQLFDFSRNSLAELLRPSCRRHGRAVSKPPTCNAGRRATCPASLRTGSTPATWLFRPTTRKYSLIKLLRRYTRDLDTYEAVVQEIELFYANNLGAALEVYVEIGQAKLRQEKDLLKTVIDNTEDGISIYDREHRVTLWNRAVEARSGISSGQVLGRKFFDVFPIYRDTPDGQAMQRAADREKWSDLSRAALPGTRGGLTTKRPDHAGATRGARNGDTGRVRGAYITEQKEDAYPVVRGAKPSWPAPQGSRPTSG
jgi:PAS domain-containing protein